jgi:excisionase family DNA binding protein
MIKLVYPCPVPRKSALPVEGPTVITISEAATVLGVTEVTLRRWDSTGKFKAHRHPVSGYRLYRRDDVLRLRKLIDGRNG